MECRAGIRTRFFASIIFLLAVGFTTTAFGQDPEGRPKSNGAAPPAETQTIQADMNSDLIKTLLQQVRDLTGEVRRLRRTIERNDQQMELLLSEEKLARIDDNISAAQQRAADLTAAERTLDYRQGHVNDEVVLRGGLDRQETEAAVRADIDQKYQEVHAGQAANQVRLSSLQTEQTQVRKHIQDLHRAISAQSDGDDGQR